MMKSTMVNSPVPAQAAGTLLAAESGCDRSYVVETGGGKLAGDGVVCKDYLELTKPRLSFFSVFTAVASYLAADTGFSIAGLVLLTLGVSLAAGGAGALNQWWEISSDARMPRTASRPLPQRRLKPEQGLAFGLILSITGLAILWLSVGWWPFFLTFLTLVTYVLWYTPMKRRTHWATEIGAIPGAFPPLVGWTAATGQPDWFGWILFGVLFFWQIPHFMAIAWMYRWDYAMGGMPVRTLQDNSGRSAALSSLISAAALAILAVAGGLGGWTGPVFTLWALLLSGWYGWKSWQFLGSTTLDADARSLFFASLIFLPAWFFPLLVDRMIF